MQRSTDRILTTHTGTLPRPFPLLEMLFARDAGKAVDRKLFDETVASAVRDIVARQRDAGLTVINDGEQSKTNFFVYRHERLAGFELVPAPGVDPAAPSIAVEARDFPEFYAPWSRTSS